MFDFFLVPHSVTQGAVKPTHFYVASNTSKISKDAILNFTYALCYNYYNWADSIKIPAPCMLADWEIFYFNIRHSTKGGLVARGASATLPIEHHLKSSLPIS